jgi:peptidyl-prolyl cis-trans isomerase B (cyclophilin B)
MTKIFLALVLITGVAACAKKEASVNLQQPAKQIVNSKNIIAGEDKMYVLLKTNKGNIVLELDAKKAPGTVENFVRYVKEEQYKGTVFHRVIKNFMIQGGGMDADMQERVTRAPVMNEANNGLENNKYTVAMARTSDPHSATAQFFINTNDNDFLNFKSETAQGWGYAVFGKVISGQDVVDAIESSSTTRRFPHENVPVDPVIIENAEVLESYNPAAK